jgi:hypothetical protein
MNIMDVNLGRRALLFVFFDVVDANLPGRVEGIHANDLAQRRERRSCWVDLDMVWNLYFKCDIDVRIVIFHWVSEKNGG